MCCEWRCILDAKKCVDNPNKKWCKLMSVVFEDRNCELYEYMWVNCECVVKSLVVYADGDLDYF